MNGSAARPEESAPEAPVSTIERASVKLRRGMSKQRLGKAAIREHGLAVDISVLHVVDAIDEGAEEREGEVTVGLVAERLGVDPSRGSRVVAEAVKAGFVRRVASQADGRRIRLELTEAGLAAVEAARRTRTAFIERAMCDWPDADRREFARLLRRYTDAFEG